MEMTGFALYGVNRLHSSACMPRKLCKMYRSSATIEDVYRLALPAGTTLLAGEEYLQRPVSWACSLRPSPPAFPKLDGNELALVDMGDLARLDPQMRLERVVRSLRGARISAMAVLGQVSDTAVETAVHNELPIFQLPDQAQLMQVERTVIRLIVDRASYIAQRSADLQRELNQIALDGGGLDRLAERLHDFCQQPVVLMRGEGRIAATAGLQAATDARQQAILHSIPNITSLRSWAAQQPLQDLGSAVGVLPLESSAELNGYRQAVVAPIFGNDAVRGFCLLLRTAGASEVSAVEEITVVQGAAAAALEWAKQNAVDIAEERMRATFVDELLAAEIADEQAWIQRGASLNYDLTLPHAAWMIEARMVPDWPAPFLRFVEENGVQAPFSRRDEGLLVFWPTDNPKSARELKTTAHEFVKHVGSHYPSARLIIGLGRPAVSPGAWIQSQQQARESWRMGKAWKGPPVTYFGDLGLYQLLTALGDNGEARRFFRKTLGLLITHDEEHNGELVETLEGFFACHGNLSQTASRLHIHRNTLSYRLERIAAITRLDLNDPDARFSLQLALKLRPIMK
jgi:purine catabolism regulator